MSGAEIHQKFSTQYGNSTLSKKSVCEWIEKFKSGQTSVDHAEGAGRPLASTTNKQQASSANDTGGLVHYH